MADYTDGLGWAKLDATAACHLADCMDMFQGRAASKRRKMLLFCYSKLNSRKVPFFRLGYRTIAKACGVSNEVAKKFLKFCCDNEIFAEFEETERGLTPKRTFWWIAEGWVLQRPHSEVETTTSRPHYRGQKYRSKTAHQTQIYQSKGESSKSDLSPRASSVCADAPTDARQKEQTPTNNELEEKEHGFVDTKDIQPGPDAIGVPQDEFDKAEQEFQKAIDEALAKNSFTGANKADFAWRDYRRSHKPVSGDA